MILIFSKTFNTTGLFYQCLNRFIFINAPSFFASIWQIVRPLIDFHTASKVDIISSKRVWQSRLLDLIGAENLPSDFGGTASPQAEKFLKITKEKGLHRQVTHPIILRFSWSIATFDFILDGEDDTMELLVLTKTQKTCTFHVTKQHALGNDLVQVVEVKHIISGDEHPTRFHFPQLLDGPGNYQVRVNCSEGSGSWVLVGKVFTKKQNTSQATYDMESSSHRTFSNSLSSSRLEAATESNAISAESRRRSSLSIMPRSEELEEQLSRLSHLERLLVPIFVTLIVFLIIVLSVFLVVSRLSR